MLRRAAAAGEAPMTRATAAAAVINLHVRVIGTSAAFWSDPVDVLGRVLDVAGLAVDAVLRVDLEPRFTLFGLHEFIDSCRTIKPLGACINRQIDRGRYVRVLERQMNRMILLVILVRDEHRREPV